MKVRQVSRGKVNLDTGTVEYELVRMMADGRPVPELPYRLRARVDGAWFLVAMTTTATGARKITPPGTRWIMIEEDPREDRA